MLVQKWLQRWTRSVISPRSVTRQEGAKWTSRIPAVYLGRTRRSAAPAVGPPGPQVPVLPLCRCPTVTGAAMTLQVRRHDKVSEPHTRMGSRSLNQAVPPIGAAGRCGRVDESVGMEFPQRLGNPVAAEATAGILRGTSRSGRSSPPSRSPQYRRGTYPHRGAPRLIGASSACPPRAAGIWWNPVFWVGVHGGSHRGESQP
jgi:hypothetical protein